MNIEQAISEDYCIICNNENELRKLSNYFRGKLTDEDIKNRSFPCYCYAPCSAFRGRLGLGFSSTNKFCDRVLKTINANELTT